MNVSSACNNYENRNAGTPPECCTEVGDSITFSPLHTTNAILDTALRQVNIMLQPLAEKVQGAELDHIEHIRLLISRALAGEAPMTGGPVAPQIDEEEVAASTADALNGLLRRYGTR
jgi:hypothetical protein